MNQPAWTKTRVLLSSALVLSLAAVASALLRPRPVLPKKDPVITVTDGVRLEGRISHVAVAETGTDLFAEYTVTLEPGALEAPRHVALALVMDRSGSMSGEKMIDARRAAHRMVELLNDGDELAVISFGSDVTAGARRVVDATTRPLFHREIDGIEASGATFLSGGVEAGRAALAEATGARRLVVVSDGHPTQGLVDAPALADLVGQVHAQAITVTALGVGADYDGNFMQHLAEVGGGMYGYLKDASTLEEVLGQEVSAARQAVARNVSLRLSSQDFTFVDAPGRHLRFVGSDTYELPLADLRPGLSTRVVVQLRSTPSVAGELARLDATVRWRPVNASEARDASVALRSVVVDGAREAEATRDEPTFARGLMAAGSLKMLAAAAAFERGDEATANGLLDNARSLFGMSADALSGQAEVEATRVDFRNADREQRKRMSRSLEKKKLSDFGRANEGY